jgi:hypothetical protein
MRNVKMAFWAIVLWLAWPAMALAAETAVGVTIPWGDWLAAAVGSMGETILMIVLSVVAWMSKSLPASIAAMLKTKQVEQILQRSVDYGLNAVAGAAKGKTLDVNTGNEVLNVALAYAVDRAPAQLLAWLGGPEALQHMILARLQLGEDASAAALGVRPVGM